MIKKLLLWLALCIGALAPALAYPPMGSVAGFPPAFAQDVAVTSWISQVVTNGGAVSAYQAYYVNQLVTTLKNASLWNSVDDVWLFASGNTAQALTSLKGLRLATTVNSPTFTAKQGYTTNGTSSYIDTGFKFSTMASNFSLSGSSAAIATYDVVNVNTNTYSTGTRDLSSSSFIGIYPRTGGSNYRCAVGSTDTNPENFVAAGGTIDSRGYTVCAKTAGPTFTVWKNGVAIGTYTPTTVNNTPAASNLYVGAEDSNGTAANFRAGTVGWLDIRAALSSGNELIYYNAVQAYMRAQGAAF